MFLDNTEISFETLSIFNLSWDNINDKSDLRPYHALSFRKKGNAVFIGQDGVTAARTGEILFVPAFYEYTLKASDEEVFVVHFSSQSNLPQEIRKFTPESAKYFERKFTELYTVWTKKQFGYEHECKSILYKILTKIEREIAEAKISNMHDSILEAVEYIHDHFTEEGLSVDYLAKMCGMSDTYFRKLFVKNFSVTPINYIKNLKINYAKELLLSGYYTIGEVSDKCGFNTINYFSSFMKKETGKTPSEICRKNTV